MFIAALSLLVGSDIDFCVRDDAWVPARIESCTHGNLRVRLAIGGAEIVRDVSATEAALQVAPAGSYTLPLLDGQPVDALIRIGESVSAPTGLEEQWQRGEYFTLTQPMRGV